LPPPQKPSISTLSENTKAAPTTLVWCRRLFLFVKFVFINSLFSTMQVRFFRVSQLVFGLIFGCLAIPSFGQFADEPDPVVEDSISQINPNLVAKTPYVVVPARDQDIADRLAQLSGCVELKPTSVVKSYVRHYVTRPEKTKRMLGRRAMYFHIFEEKLKEHGLPEDLKYLAVVESALNPQAVSRVGASGLWQFMPATGTEYGMQINSAIDERYNVVKSSDAAARYLKALYAEFGDWALALAAYNSGPNRVHSAIRRSGSRNFWSLQRFLPTETRNYVPAFVAATYICTYFTDHSIQPDYPELDAQLTDYIMVYEGMSFSAIASATGLSYDAVSTLNPGFKRSYVPPSTRGYYVMLPRRVMPAFVRHLNGLGGRQYRLEAAEYEPSTDFGDGKYYMTQITPSESEYVDRFAQKIGCTGAQLRAWNNLPNHFVYPNEPLKIWNPVLVQKHSKDRIEAPKVNATAATKPTSPASGKPTAAGTKPTTVPVTATTGKPTTATATTTSTVKPTTAAATTTKPVVVVKPQQPAAANGKEYQWHTVAKGEKLSDISRRYGVSTDALMMLNNTSDIKAGQRLKIKEIKK
jgi:membrane-bound lytic murein transglycosylase D